MSAPPPIRDALHFPPIYHTALEPYLPPPATPPPPSTTSTPLPLSSAQPQQQQQPQQQNPPPRPGRPFLTLTFATSLDSALSLAPGTQTALSGRLSKAMTHHLRARHDAILVGAGTAVADDPSLNCRAEGVGGGDGGRGLGAQPRPVVLDARATWDWRGAKVLGLAAEGRGKGPWVLVRGDGARAVDELERVGGEVVVVEGEGRMEWREIMKVLWEKGIRSIMVEGGGTIINELLEPRNAELVDSVIVTIAPTWLGQGGVVVSPQRRVDAEGKPVPAARLRDVRWIPLEEDVVLCGRLTE